MAGRGARFLNYTLLGLDPADDYEEPDALSSDAFSSPYATSEAADGPNLPFEDLEYLSEGEDEMDDDYVYQPRTPVKRSRRAPPLSDSEKTKATLEYMRSTWSHFSTRKLLQTMFTSDDSNIKTAAGMFMSASGHLEMMDIWWENFGLRDSAMMEWVVDKAADVCRREASWLSDRASHGPNSVDAETLRVPAKSVTMQMTNDFRLYDLTKKYDKVTPHLQTILTRVIEKDPALVKPGSRNPDAGRTLITSMLLNLRSRIVNYHAVMNSLIFWDSRVPKRLVQALNHFGITTSYPSQARSIMALSKDSILMARKAANNPNKIIMLPYDNFNWTARAWEATATHSSTTHDEVSALLVILPKPTACTKTAKEITDISAFLVVEGFRHKISPSKSLCSIMPTSDDQKSFRNHAIIHIQTILSEEIKAFSEFLASIPIFTDPQALPLEKTEEYYLPTFDQEQGSTRGNMVVLEHYFGKVLDIPAPVFETTMFTVLGDRLTTVRDRAAQDQRAVDRSDRRFDHLSSFSMISGLMHFSLNFISAIGSNTWGETGASDPVSLSTLRDLLPNRGEINLRKVDYYAWIRFLDVVLRSLVIKAAMCKLSIDSSSKLDELQGSVIKSPEEFHSLAIQIVDSYVLPSVEKLEANGIKPLCGSTQSGHAILLMHDLMTLREMQRAVKYGHPGHIQRMIKYWMPMFYAAGSYNYANECMEILHNYKHDWPSDYAQTAFNGMLVNPTGKPGNFKPTDIRVEHLNDRIKERAHGSNATPDILEKITPAMGVVQNLTDNLFEDLGVEYQNQHHTNVLQHKDIEIMVKHLAKNHIFDFTNDKVSKHLVVDLYRSGAVRLAGKNGGHSKHLARHILRLQKRHGDIIPAAVENPAPIQDDIDEELNFATDSTFPTPQSDSASIWRNDELRDLVNQAEIYN